MSGATQKAGPARLAALRVLDRVLRWGGMADEELGRFKPEKARDVSLANSLVHAVLRNLLRIDCAIEQAAGRGIGSLDPVTADALRLGASELMILGGVPAYAAISSSVELVRAARNPRATGLVNAVLRRIAAGDFTIPDHRAGKPEDLAIGLSHPLWFVNALVAEYGAVAAAELCAANNRESPLAFRANRLKTTREDLGSLLSAAHVRTAACLLSPAGLSAEGMGSPARLAPFRKGLFTVQDEASQLVSFMLDPRPGEHILDCCSAPGTKATHLAELSDDRARIFAADVSEKRLGLLRENVARLGTGSVIPLSLDFSTEGGACVTTQFDAVLLDAPCSDTGIFGRHPELRWRRSGIDPSRRASLQAKLLSNAAAVLKPGGRLVYSVCSILPEEGRELIRSFLSSNQGFIVEPPDRPDIPWSRVSTPEGFVLTLPHVHGCDGFFACRLRKRGI